MELPSQEKVVKKGGRPKLEPGKKGQYNVSRKQQAKLRVQKKETKARKKKVEATVKKLKQIITKPSGSKVIEQETLDAAPKAVRDLVEDTSEIIFKPNDGPQTDFLASPEGTYFMVGLLVVGSLMLLSLIFLDTVIILTIALLLFAALSMNLQSLLIKAGNFIQRHFQVQYSEKLSQCGSFHREQQLGFPIWTKTKTYQDTKDKHLRG